MSMEHKAFAFNYPRFEAGLRDILIRGLSTDDPGELREFVVKHRSRLRDPYEGLPLSDDWEAALEVRDVHQYGDFALTYYYDPAADVGLGSAWLSASEMLDKLQPNCGRIVLGRALGSPGREFDPGKMGAYFQSSDDLASNKTRLLELLRVNPDLRTPLAAVARMLEVLSSSGQGAYITF